MKLLYEVILKDFFPFTFIPLLFHFHLFSVTHLVPMTNESYVRLVFAKDVCVYTFKRSMKSFLFLLIVFSCFCFAVLFYRASKLPITSTTNTIKPNPFPKAAFNENFLIEHAIKNVSSTNGAGKTLTKNKNLNRGVVVKEHKLHEKVRFIVKIISHSNSYAKTVILDQKLSKILRRRFASALGIQNITNL